jgi:amino-acid N-acetyltransferase
MITIRKARLSDVPQMMPILHEYARQAEILPRQEADVYQSIRDWVVVEADGHIAGMGALLVMWHDLAEIRSLVIASAFHSQGLGRAIVNQLVAEARTLELPRIFALTRKPGFFLKLGFHMTRIEDLPRKVHKDCVFCPKFHACDEVAVIMPLTQSAAADYTLNLSTLQPGNVEHRPLIPLMSS